MTVEEARTCCTAIDQFIGKLVDLELPLPDEVSTEAELLGLYWSATEATFWFEPDAKECGMIDEFEAAILKGVDPAEWPYPTAEGYAEYVPEPRR